MKLTTAQRSTLLALWKAGDADFATLVGIAGLNPAKDFRAAHLQGVQFGSADLAGFDFTGADLRDADLRKAFVTEAVFDQALTEGAKFPSGTGARSLPAWRDADQLRPHQLDAVRSVIEHLNSGKRSAAVVMAQGTGKTMTLLALLQALAEQGKLKSALILAPRIAILQQIEDLMHSVAHPEGRRAGRMVWPTQSGPAHVVLTTPQGLGKVLKERPFQTFSHVIYLEGETRKRALDRASFRGAEIAFFSALPSEKEASWSEHVVYAYLLQQAIADQLLGPLTVRDCTDVVAARKRSEAPRLGRLTPGEVRLAVRHFMDQALDLKIPDLLSVVICDRVPECERVAGLIEDEVRIRHRGGGDGPYAYVRGHQTFPPPIPDGVGMVVTTWEHLDHAIVRRSQCFAVLGVHQPPRRRGGWTIFHLPDRATRRDTQIYDYSGAAMKAFRAGEWAPGIEP